MNRNFKHELLKKIPSVDRILCGINLKTLPLSRELIVETTRNYLKNLREKIVAGTFSDEPDHKEILQEILLSLKSKTHLQSGRALNATGVILHTGLGRAVLPKRAVESIYHELQGYNVLEIDRDTGERSRRDLHLRDILRYLTGAEDATVVNNNAAAVLIVLSTLAHKKEVIVSNSQLVEIGGSFRIPEIIAESGARFISVGCTNKVYLKDYERAISEQTNILLHVHRSNFAILGFTHDVELAELAKLAHKKNLILVEDAGSGAITDLSPWGFEGEPVIRECIQQGADLVTFSGDKLLGGCQAGIIVGKASLIEKIRRHPLARALRVDKMTLIALEATLRLYYDNNTLQENPTFTMLTTPASIIEQKAMEIVRLISEEIPTCKADVVPTLSRVGSGALPISEIPSHAVAISAEGFSSGELARSLRLNHPPVFSRIYKDTLLLDPRTLQDGESEEVVDILKNILCRKSVQ